MPTKPKPVPPRKQRKAPGAPAASAERSTKTRKTLPKSGKPTPDDVLVVLSKLTPADKDLLRWLYTVRYAITQQIHRRFFADDKTDEKVTLQNCRRRLWELGRDGVVAGVTYARCHRAWVLDKKGLLAAEELMRVAREKRISPDDWSISAMYLEHTLNITEIAVQLEEARCTYRWHNSRRRLLWSVKFDQRGQANRAYLSPDATVEIQWGREENGRWQSKGWWTIYLEVDMNTELRETIREKIVRYAGALALRRSMSGEDDMAPQDSYVVFACSDHERAEDIQLMIDQSELKGSALAVPLDRATDAILHIWDRLHEQRKRLEEQARIAAEAEQRRKEAAERERVRQEQLAAWAAYDRAVQEYQAREGAYVTQHKSWIKSEEKCRQEFRGMNPVPTQPAFPQPSSS